MLKIAVIGAYEEVASFGALGVDVFDSDSESMGRILKNLSENGYGIIYISESLVQENEKEYAKYKERAIPAVIPIPDKKSAGFAAENIRKAVIQAVGSEL